MRDPQLTARARGMRRNATETEIRLRLELRGKCFAGTKFRRQKVIGPYVVDFAANCPMLIVEVDGDTHSHQVAYDAERTRYLQRQGYRVIRFTNSDIMTNMEGALTMLADAIALPPAPLPTLSPEGARAI